MTPFSPLRYPGGKGVISPFITQLVEENDIQCGTYIEPYAGGAGVALSLLLSEKVSKIVINDLDRSIYAFWYAVLKHNEELCEMIKNIDLTSSQWKAQKDIQGRKGTAGLFELGFSTFFMNRTNRSGILNAWPIGGIEQSGAYKMDARFYRNTLISRIQEIGKHADGIEVFNKNAADFLKNDIDRYGTENCLIYMDPPYYRKGPTLYMNYYKTKDHSELSDIVKGLDHHWVISYDDAPEIRDLYAGYRMNSYALKYSAREVKKGREIMYFSHALNLPDISIPTGFKG